MPTRESLADRMWRKRHQENPDPTLMDDSQEEPATSLVSEDEVYLRVRHVLDGLRSLLPPQMSGTRQVGVLTEIMRGMQRDISLVPPDEVKNFMRAISEACAWIADGSMEDLEIDDNPDDDSMDDMEE